MVLGRVIKEDLLSGLDVSYGIQTKPGQSRVQAINIDSIHSQIWITGVINEVGNVAVLSGINGVREFILVVSIFKRVEVKGKNVR